MVGPTTNEALLLKACSAGDWIVVRRLAGRVVRRAQWRDRDVFPLVLNELLHKAALSGSLKTVLSLLAAYPPVGPGIHIVRCADTVCLARDYMLIHACLSGSARLVSWVLSGASLRPPLDALPVMIACCCARGQRAVPAMLYKMLAKEKKMGAQSKKDK
jgi:hypothetical protein